MAFVSERHGPRVLAARDEAPEFERVACVTAICLLAALPFAFFAAVSIWGV